MAADGPILGVEGLTFRYRRASEPAIRDVSVAVRPGEVLLVAGPSGCGKSTLIRAMNGLIPHAYSGDLRGQVTIGGRPTTELRLRDVALVVATLLQDPAKQIVGSTVEAELAFGPENLGTSPGDIRRRLAAVMERTGIGGLAGRSTDALSGGERQLLAMAGTLMTEPRAFVVDEPLANLDPATAGRLLRLLRALADEGHAVVIVEHRVEEALALRPNRVLYLEEGRVSYLGGVDGFLAVADPRAVKLPFAAVVERVRALDGALWHDTPRRPRGPGDGSRLAWDDVHVRLGDRDVLRGVSADLHAREVVALLGPNGSGKTTMFRTAMRLLEPGRGSLRIDGMPMGVRTTADLARTFGYVFQSPSQMLFARTVREELMFGPRNLGLPLPEAEAAAATALRRTSLADEEAILDRPPLTLSFGQQKRLALAIGLALEPRTLILDEPSAGQDHRSCEAFMDQVLGIDGLESLYFVTHDVDLALTRADRILVIRDGRLVADGAPPEVCADEETWIASNLHRTSLISANLRWRPETGRFLGAIDLARHVIAGEAASRGGSTIEPA